MRTREPGRWDTRRVAREWRQEAEEAWPAFSAGSRGKGNREKLRTLLSPIPAPSCPAYCIASRPLRQPQSAVIGASGRSLQGQGSSARAQTASRAPEGRPFFRDCLEEAPESPSVEVAAPEVVMATEPVAAEPAVPSLVDRYFTRWYKAGKRGTITISPWPHWPDGVGTMVTHWKPCELSPALFLHFRRNWTTLLLSRSREWAFAKASRTEFWGWRVLCEFLGGLPAGRW